jgi:hypothetical protein
MEIKVGDVIYVYDREYRDRIEHDGLPKNWRKTEVTRETKVSWIIKCRLGETKIPKKSFGNNVGLLRTWHWNEVVFAKTAEDVEHFEFIECQRYKLSEAVKQCSDYDKLKEIQRILEG